MLLRERDIKDNVILRFMDPDKFNNKTGKVILASGRGYYVFKPNPLPLKVLYD